jgi:heme-degrading monooxygenase HmoA
MIAQIIDHWVFPDKQEQARELFAANSHAIRKVPGLIERRILQSKKDPLKWTAINIWESEAAARAWGDSPEHIWDVFGKTPVIPPGTDYHRKYATASSVQSKPAVSEAFELVAD